MPLALNFLGEFQVFANEALTAFATNQARALLVYLAVESTRAHQRESLAYLLWPDDRAVAARQNLSQTLLRMRQAIGDPSLDKTLSAPPIFQITRQTLQLNLSEPMTDVVTADVVTADTVAADTITVDVLEFQALLAACANHSHADRSQCSVCVERFLQAVNLVRGPFLEDFPTINSTPFEEWLLVTREQLQRQRLDTLHALTLHYAAADNQPKAQQFAARQLQIEPWRESAHRQLMLALARNGQRGAALAQYESCRRLLAEELAVEPETDTVALMEQIRSGEYRVRNAEYNTDTSHSALHTPHSAFGTRDPHLLRSRLQAQPDEQLFGVAAARARLHALLQATAAPWIIAIDGLGGIGKTTLATSLAHEFVESDRFADIALVSAKQEEFHPAAGIQTIAHPALDSDGLVDALLGQLLPQLPPAMPRPERRTALLRHLKTQPCLMIVDNLESVADTDALLPELRHFANPSKILITTRFSLRSEAGIFAYALSELSKSDVVNFLRYEAETRNITRLLSATPQQLNAIYNDIYSVVGGNPLALKLVVGQARFLPLPQVLRNLEEAQGKRVEALYSYIYWQAWQLLTTDERQLFVSLPLAPHAAFDQLCLVSDLDEERLQVALTRLIDLSLLQVGGDLSEPRYYLHRLTETFLMQEVLKWQSVG